MNLERLIEGKLADLVDCTNINPNNNKYVLSLINDYEEGIWREDKFNQIIWDNIAETALSVKEREALIDSGYSKLVASAKKLRLVNPKAKCQGGQIAEILLYAVMKYHYGALPIVPKIFYKQNSQDEAKGADSVHIVIEEDNTFSIWFGEAKFYNSIQNDRLGSIVESVKKSLDKEKIKKENSIITNLSDIHYLVTDDRLRNDILDCLKPAESIDKIKPRLHIPIMMLNECLVTQSHYAITKEYKNQLIAFHIDRAQAYFERQTKSLNHISGYADITFHLVIIPVFKKKPIVEDFRKRAKFFRDES